MMPSITSAGRAARAGTIVMLAGLAASPVIGGCARGAGDYPGAEVDGGVPRDSGPIQDASSNGTGGSTGTGGTASGELPRNRKQSNVLTSARRAGYSQRHRIPDALVLAARAQNARQ